MALIQPWYGAVFSMYIWKTSHKVSNKLGAVSKNATFSIQSILIWMFSHIWGNSHWLSALFYYLIWVFLCQIQKVQKQFLWYILHQQTSWSHVLDIVRKIRTWLNNGISFHLNEIYIIYHIWKTKNSVMWRNSSLYTARVTFSTLFSYISVNLPMRGGRKLSLLFPAMGDSCDCSLIQAKLS